jgi:hypothetical protein
MLHEIDFKRPSAHSVDRQETPKSERDAFALQILCALLGSRPNFSDHKCCLYAYSIADMAISTSKLTTEELKDQIRIVGFR